MFLVVVVLGGLLYGLSIYFSLQNAMKEMHKPLEEDAIVKEVENADMQIDHPFSMLLLGVDERQGDIGRSDTIILVTVNPILQSVKMLSIPRDTRTEIVGNHTIEKINHAYVRGGIPMTVATVEHFLNVPIDYYVKINMEGFLSIIKIFDGVTVNNDMDLTYQNYRFPKGEITLSADEALIFSRIRYEDPRGDFGRQIRQRQLIEAIAKKGASMSSIWKYKEIFNTLGENVQTNFTMGEMIGLTRRYGPMSKQIEQLNFKQGSGRYIGSYWYYIANTQEVESIGQQLRNHLRVTTASQ